MVGVQDTIYVLCELYSSKFQSFLLFLFILCFSYLVLQLLLSFEGLSTFPFIIESTKLIIHDISIQREKLELGIKNKSTIWELNNNETIDTTKQQWCTRCFDELKTDRHTFLSRFIALVQSATAWRKLAPRN